MLRRECLVGVGKAREVGTRSTKNGRASGLLAWHDSIALMSLGIGSSTKGHVIAFLRESLKSGMPTWKRLKVVDALIVYRDRVRQSANSRFESIRARLAQRVAMEKNREQDAASSSRGAAEGVCCASGFSGEKREAGSRWRAATVIHPLTLPSPPTKRQTERVQMKRPLV